MCKISALVLEDDVDGSEVSTDLGSDAQGSLERQAGDRSQPAPPQACENLVIFEWDDTLFPTTWLGEQGLLDEDCVITPAQDAQLEALADLAAVTLETAKRRGGVAIVTNAEQGWVEMSCEAIMPSLQPHLAGVTIVSARSRHERPGFFEPTRWKCLAFEELVREVYGAADPSGVAVRRNISSIGDSEYEMEALKWIATSTDCHAKCLKLVQQPCLEKLMEQHEQLARIVDEVVDYHGNLDYKIGV
ncbi:unnamed protein product [Prorocentrum cordatum]|uniref:Uncharacterized protein n=1 Tax=Prorocentrum cordatum TaxID=2364126 RepID=A0ABN9P6W0_9DINO|nr:unnamed protein product [Polarella glacialis]